MTGLALRLFIVSGFDIGQVNSLMVILVSILQNSENICHPLGSLENTKD